MKITLKDGSVKEYSESMAIIDIAKDISEGLARNACAAELNGKVVDLRTTISEDSELNILTFNDEAGKAAYRHTTSHVLAEAVKRLYPEAKLAIGPSIDTGFYYDFDIPSFDREALDDMLERTGIKKFADAAYDLSAVWFGDGSYNDVTRRVERFIISGGVYGNADNSMAVSQQTEKGRIGYILHRIWLPYEMLCTVYPRLRGRRILQPAYEVKRWFRIFDPKARKRKSRDLSAIGRLQTEKKEEVNRMLKELGLM